LSDLAEPVSFDGFFLNLVTDRTSDSKPMFVANQIAWHPTIDSKLPGLNPGKIFLASGGVDIGLFDRISKRFALPFNHEDSYCLYQIIHAIDRLHDELIDKADHGELDIVKLFDRKRKLNGNTYEIIGNIQRVTRIEVERDDSSAKHELDHYYQIDLFIDIDYESLRLSDKDGEALVFDTQFPLTIVTGELPAWLPTGSQQNIRVAVDAFFMRIWSYQSAYARRISEGRRQQSPLMVAYRFERIDSTSGGFSRVLTIGIFLFVGVVGVLVFGFWWSDKKGGPKRSKTAATLPDTIEIPNVD
ncbi:hypothetical protein N9242_01005, partial [Vicingaceae bacterium]|nr:hypothetical protein [Vicingaceae bacterium]